MEPLIYYDSRTGNVERFVHKIKAITGWPVIRINEDICISHPGHLITYTTRIGEVPDHTELFMSRYANFIYSVSSSGNRNWGVNFAKAAEKIANTYDVPIFLQFELSGTSPDVQQMINLIKKSL